jgi:chaperonin cofactor prefoldin
MNTGDDRLEKLQREAKNLVGKSMGEILMFTLETLEITLTEMNNDLIKLEKRIKTLEGKGD